MTDAAARRTGFDAAVTAVVLTLDEEAHLPDCLRSLRWADRVVVVDSGSRDGTVAIARAAGADVVTHPFVNYARQRQFALGLADTRWVLFVDADERVPEALAAEVRAVLAATTQRTFRDAAAAPADRTSPSSSQAGFWIPRANEFWGRTLRGGGWWPDRQLRLLDTRRARYDPDHGVHEVAELDGPAGVLEHALRHLNYASWSEFDAKQRAYARLEVERRRAAAWRWRPHQLITQPARALWRRYVTLGGWRDGWLGVRLALRMAWYEAVTVFGLRDP